MENGEASLKCLKSVKGTPSPSLPLNGGLGDTLAAFPTAQKERKKLSESVDFRKILLLNSNFARRGEKKESCFPFYEVF